RTRRLGDRRSSAGARGCGVDLAWWRRNLGIWPGAVDFSFAHFPGWVGAYALAQSRCSFPQSGRPKLSGRAQFGTLWWHLQRFSAWLSFRVWLDTMHRADSRGRAGHGRYGRDCLSRHFSFGLLFGWLGDSVSAHGLGNQSIYALLPAVSPPPACRRSRQRRVVAGGGIFDLL